MEEEKKVIQDILVLSSVFALRDITQEINSTMKAIYESEKMGGSSFDDIVANTLSPHDLSALLELLEIQIHNLSVMSDRLSSKLEERKEADEDSSFIKSINDYEKNHVSIVTRYINCLGEIAGGKP